MLELNNINKKYKECGETIGAVTDVSLRFEAGEFVALIGESGCGKTTLLNIMAGLLSPTSGEVIFDKDVITEKSEKERISYRRKHVGMITQNFSLLNDRSVYKNIELPLSIDNYPKEKREILISKFMKKMKISDKRNMYPDKLSGGQQQRVSIARALVKNPDIVLADEPTGALDEENAEKIIRILRNIADEGKIVIMVTHDMKLVQRCDRYIQLENGRCKNT